MVVELFKQQLSIMLIQYYGSLILSRGFVGMKIAKIATFAKQLKQALETGMKPL
jgi:hypothetical protein